MLIGGVAQSLAMAAILAGSTAPTKAEFPADLAHAFQDVHQSLGKVITCLGEEASNESAELDARDQRLTKVGMLASGIWGWESARPSDHLSTASTVDCNARNIPSLLAESDAALDALEASFSKHSAMFNKGIWIGNLPLCGVGPVTIKMIDDEFSGRNALLITLNKTVAAELAVLTNANVGYPLAIRANGAILMEPQINEPLMAGQMQLIGPERAELEKVSALLSQCAEVR